MFSIDWEDFDGVDLAIDIEELEIDHLPWIPDMIWASPDCTTYTIAACSKHRENSIIPKSDYAIKCDRVNQRWIELIKAMLIIKPEIVFFIENPRGMLRKMPWMQEFDRHTVWYCQYGDTRAKPTDIWTNSGETCGKNGSRDQSVIISETVSSTVTMSQRQEAAEQVHKV